MALQTNYTYNGITINNAYCRVNFIQGNKASVVAEIGFHASENDQAFYSKAISFVPDMDGDNFIKQAYEHLKTLPEFANATDC